MIQRQRWFCFLVAVSVTGTVGAQPNQGNLPGKNSPSVLAAYREVVAQPSQSTVRIQCDGKDVALGTIVSADGHVLTKNSELKGDATVILRNGKKYDAQLVGVHEKWDLALLKIEAKDLTPIAWKDAGGLKPGTLLATVAPADEPVAVGVVSVKIAPSKGGGGFLGIGLANDENVARLGTIQPNSAASKAGLQAGDVILQVNDTKINGPEALVGTLGSFKPGDKVTLKVQRNGEEMTVEATLGKRPELEEGPGGRPARGGNPGAFFGPPLSKRRTGFPEVLTHDTVIRPADCGGPVVDLEGKAVGINIARAARIETYLAPSEDVRKVLPDLIAGKLPAPKKEPEKTDGDKKAAEKKDGDKKEPEKKPEPEKKNPA